MIQCQSCPHKIHGKRDNRYDDGFPTVAGDIIDIDVCSVSQDECPEKITDCPIVKKSLFSMPILSFNMRIIDHDIIDGQAIILIEYKG